MKRKLYTPQTTLLSLIWGKQHQRSW